MVGKYIPRQKDIVFVDYVIDFRQDYHYIFE